VRGELGEGGDGWKREEGFSDEARRGKIPQEGGRVTSQEIEERDDE